MHSFTIVASLLTLLTSIAASALPVSVEKRSGKPTGGPATITVTVYSGPYTCVNKSTPPPTDGSAGTSQVVSVAETQCAILNIPFGGAITSVMTATPKTGTAGCYVQIHTQSGCGLTLQNEYHGFPFDGIVVGSKVGCVTPPVISYGAVEVVCA